MRKRNRLLLQQGSWFLMLTTAAGVLCTALHLRAQPTDPGWPRVFMKGKKELTVYQPQVDYWNGYTNLHFRCAIEVKGVAKQEKFGVAEIDAVTVTDQASRTVTLMSTRRELRFPNTSDSEAALLKSAVDEIRPLGQPTTVSLDRVLAYLNPADQPVQKPVELNLDPPKIFYSQRPALMVMIMGDPQFLPVDTNKTDLMFALNTNWDLFYDTVTRRYYLLNQDNWLSAADIKGPWTPAQTLPPSLWSLPPNENWADVKANLPGKRANVVPTVFVTMEPAELIVTQGAPSYTPIPDTRLMRVANTDSVLFMDTGDGKFYFLVAGRWFRAASLDGPWSAASRDLPADFARIPDSDPSSFVKACVPGTREAQDAVLLASVPMTTTVATTNPVVQVVYDGTPQFAPIQTTTVQYAINSPYSVFLVSGRYYCCDAGIWFVSSAPVGPWVFCTTVPTAIYTIPPSSPYYNVTYVKVQSYTPTTVIYTQTAGYSGEYVAATGVLMFGAGMLVGAAIAHNHYYHYYPPYPYHYSYGCGAVYHHGYGGYYYRGGAAYGPYGGAGFTASYNPATGTYSRSAYAYGPRGSVSVQSAYNPYTGAYARSAQVNTPYGSAGRAAGYNPYTGTAAAGGYRSTAYGTAAAGRAYNPYTGARAAGGQVTTAAGSAGRAAGYNPTTGNAAAGGYVSGQAGNAAGVRTSQGSGAAAWNTQYGQGAVGKTKDGDVYAAKDGTVYKKDPNGGWSQNSGGGWQSVSKTPATYGSTGSTANRPASSQTQAGTYQQQRPGTASTTSKATSGSSNWSQNRQTMESQAQSRSWGNQQTQKTQSWQSSGQGGGSGSARGTGRRG